MSERLSPREPGRQMTRQDLAELIQEREYGENFNPVLITWDDGKTWHYPLSSRFTLCEETPPPEFRGGRMSELFVASTMLCDECGHPSATNAPAIRWFIPKVMGFESESASQRFAKQDTMEILAFAERARRGELETVPTAPSDG